MKLWVAVVAFVVVVLHNNAFAQGTPPEPESTGMTSHFLWNAGAYIALPQDDLNDAADTSVGIRAEVGYRINPNLSVHGAFRYVFVNIDNDIEDFVDSVSYYDFGAGVRYAFGTQGNLSPFVDGELIYSSTSAEGAGVDTNSSDPGIVVRGGAAYAWRPAMDIIFFGSYTHLFLDEDDWGPDASGGWLALGAGVQGYF